MFTERPLPSRPWRNAIIVIAFTLLTIIMILVADRVEIDWLAAIPFLIAPLVGYYLFWVRHCPECGGRLISRKEFIRSTTKFRWISRCERCQVDWETGIRGDTIYDDQI